jgi:phage shock protein PspC (stress-responsive transcriptional regulator)
MEFQMQAQMVQDEQKYVPVVLRPHTILGVCEAIGEDFGFNPTLLRVPFAATVLLSPMMAIAAYFALGGVVLLSRLLFPKPKPDKSQIVPEQPATANEQVELARAA